MSDLYVIKPVFSFYVGQLHAILLFYFIFFVKSFPSKTDSEIVQDGETPERWVGGMPREEICASWPSTETCSAFISASLRVFVEKTGR
jgi:hypothetical protein